MSDIDVGRAEDAAYLVARGGRALALLPTVEAEPLVMSRMATVIEQIASEQNCMSFVIDRGDGRATCGFAQHRWAIDAYAEMAVTSPTADRADALTETDHAFLGLMLGYSSQAIDDYLRRSPLNRLWKEG